MHSHIHPHFAAILNSFIAPRIVTEHVKPPIPIRSMDWRATQDGYEPGDPVGYGETEQAAIADLKHKMESNDE